MQLQKIDKPLFKQRHKQVVIGLCASLAILSLGISTALIAAYGNSEGGNTGLNAAGVLLALAILLIVVQKFKDKPYFKEVFYVWKLKQELTQINRRIGKIKSAAETGDINAIIILNFCYTASEQVWQLEDNTLVMEELRSWMSALEQLQQRYNVNVSLEDYQRGLLDNY